MTLLAFNDLESNGLLTAKKERDGTIVPPMDRVHCIAVIFRDGPKERRISAGPPEARSGVERRGWEWMPVVDALKLLETADIRVGHNAQDFDERAIRRVYQWFNPKLGSKVIDTLILSRLLYPDINRSGPNGFKLPGNMRRLHNLKSWGIRLGEHKGDYTGGWAEWCEDMQAYMEQDAVVLVKLFQWLMAQKPSAEANELEHDFASIIRRQEDRGFAFDMDEALVLLGELTTREAYLEGKLIAAFGEWWAYGKAANAQAGRGREETYQDQDDDEDAEDPVEQEKRKQEWLQRRAWGGDVVVPTTTRNVKLLGFPDITVTRLSPKTGKELKPYVGPPLVNYAQGHAYTPIKRIQFNPSSRTHITQRLIVKYGWEPSRFTKGGKAKPPVPKVDDEVLRGLPYPEAQMLADYYLVLKRLGQLSVGKKAWLKVVRETELPTGQRIFRIHGRMNTNGAVTGRCTHMDPNMSQVPKNTAGAKECPDYPEVQGARCRALFVATPPYDLVGFDASSLELCMLAHYVRRWDDGAYARIVAEGRKADGTDPHSWMRTTIIGENIIGAGEKGRDNSKTAIYAYLYGAGDEKLGSIVIPTGTLNEKRALGKEIKGKLLTRFDAMRELKVAIEETVQERGFLLGLDGRKLRVRKAHAALNTLLQSAGAIVMKKSLVLLDHSLQENGLKFGPDYEFVANIHDEAQAEVLPVHSALYSRLALEAVPAAGLALRVLCPLKAEVSTGHSWKDTH